MIVCNLDNYLKQSNLSISAFCEEIGISRTYYYELIKAEKMPTIEICYRIKHILQDELKKSISIEEIWIVKYC